jgi:opacity protein-like surface antigen
MRTLLSVMICGCLFFAPNFSRADEFGAALRTMGANTAPDALSASRGNTWAADPEGSSNNPACVSASEPFKKVSGSVNYNATIFKKGPTLHSYDTSLYVNVPGGGVAEVTLGNSRSGSAATRMDSNVQTNHQPYFEVQYGRKVKEDLLRDGDKLYLGAGAGMDWSKMGFASQGQNTTISRSRGMTLNCGALYQPNENWNFGASYSWSRSWDEDRDLENASSSRSISNTHQVRVGASWKVLPQFGTTLSADVQYLNLGNTSRVQPFVGVEQQIVKDRLYVYGGWAATGPTIGLGYYLKNGGINVAYGNNLHADLNPHLGRSQTIAATVFFKW